MNGRVDTVDNVCLLTYLNRSSNNEETRIECAARLVGSHVPSRI